MSMQKYMYSFEQENEINYNCPVCNKEGLEILEGSFISKETKKSIKKHNNYYWCINDVELIYSCIFQCKNRLCEELITSSGIGYPDEDIYEDEHGSVDIKLKTYFRPKFFHPNLKIFNYPNDLPINIIYDINKSFELFFCNTSSSANYMRQTLEDIITHLGVNDKILKSGNESFLKLHERINLIPNKFDHIKELAFAIKWVGNDGSHSGILLKLSDILDIYKIMEEIIRQVFIDKDNDAYQLAEIINKNKGVKK